MDDLWLLDAFIHLKRAQLLKLIRGAVLWTIWLERNCNCFHSITPKTVQAFDIKFLSLVQFWCTHLGDSLLHDIKLILPQDVQRLHL
jgi:hypothetical protein